MALLNEYAIGPRVFHSSGYSSTELGDSSLAHLRLGIFEDGLVRNLRNGDWLKSFTEADDVLLKYAKEILKKLSAQGRLRPTECALQLVPSNDKEWCDEALESHRMASLLGIIACSDSASHFHPNELVADITRLANTPWWKNRSNSVRLRRSTEDYADHLRLVLSHANSLMFIDPHLDPKRTGYRNIADLLVLAGSRTPAPKLEIHRVCYCGSGANRQFPSIDYFETSFREALASKLQAVQLSVEVFVWDDFHDRYLISNLAGITVPYGFDTTSDVNSLTTWTRIGREQRDDIQREFDPAAKRHTLKHRFVIT